jgi:hypothetical protein
MTLAFDQRGNGLGTSIFPTLRFSWGDPFSRLHYGSLSLRPADLLALLSELTGLSPANEGFYFRASDGLITRSAAEYNYGGNWASSTGGTFTR